MMYRPLGTYWRASLFSIGATMAALLLIGIPTVVIPNPWFTRMIPTRPQDYLFLGITAALVGMIAASYALPAVCPRQDGKLATGGFLSFLAVACPICNKAIVLLIGTSGALTFFEPLQPVLAVLAIVLLAFAAWLRWRPHLPTLGPARR